MRKRKVWRRALASSPRRREHSPFIGDGGSRVRRCAMKPSQRGEIGTSHASCMERRGFERFGLER